MMRSALLNEIIYMDVFFREIFESRWQGVEVQTELVQL
jgi:hypothetical protein